MMVHVPMCTHKDPKNVLIVSDDDQVLQQELLRYLAIKGTTISVQNALESIRDLDDDSYDVIMCETQGNSAFLAHLSRVAAYDALLVVAHLGLNDVDTSTQLMQTLGHDFKIMMPYNAGEQILLLASKAYHPTADVILQRADLLEGQEYYNSDIHVAAFAMPNYIRKTYRGIIRN